MKPVHNPLLLIVFIFGLLTATHAQLKDGDIVRIKNMNSGKFAVPKDVSTAPDAEIVINTGRTDAWFTWKVIAVPGGGYKFQNVHTGYFLGILNASKDQYGFVVQRQKPSHPDIIWLLVKTTKGYKIKNKNSGLLIGIDGGGTASNSRLVQWGDNGATDKEWQFETTGTGNSQEGGRKILFDISLNNIAVSEATRNRIDNGDCKRIFGVVAIELWELDNNNEMKTRLRSYNNMSELLYQQTNFRNPPTAALSKYQDDINSNAQMGKVTYNIPENLLTTKRLMLVVKTNLGTRHKDNDFASYDALKMKEEIQSTFILDARATRTETIETITDLSSSTRDMHFLDTMVPFAMFQKTDDTHKIWVKISCKRN
jgi:hypothetical protein